MNIGTFFIGLLIFIAGGTIVIFHRQIGDNLASGISSYDKVKLTGVIIAILGFIVMVNLHAIILNGIINLIFKR